MHRLVVAALTLACAACAGSSVAPVGPAPRAAVASPAPSIVVGVNAVGPVTADTPANLLALRDALRGYTVKPANDGMFGELHFEVWQGEELLFYVIPSDDGTIFNLHIMSPTVEIANRAWRATKPFTQPEYLTHCECWAQKPVCYRKGDHVAVAFDRPCDVSALEQPAARKQLGGVPIHRAVWNPRPFAEEGEATE